MCFRGTTQYLPFYGGAKGQYLEVKKDDSGAVVSEKIVAEENISEDNVIKNTNKEDLLYRVFVADLNVLKGLIPSCLRLLSLGKRQGYLKENDKTKLKQLLAALSEAASNTIKLVDEVGEDVDKLYKKDPKLKRYEDGNDDDTEDVGEEGVTIENPDGPYDEPSYPSSLIAEAKPYGLAVVGDQGIASSRPKATAVAQNGVAIAKPVATAIAGLDPSALDIDFSLNPSSRDYKNYKPQTNSSKKN